ncbi:MAG: methionine--tRNA ligase subunit beta, partial [Pseudomonadota bacterium]|nr:methionine--tRNA ligase subunit beta [Pseudomonadota bacterium]
TEGGLRAWDISRDAPYFGFEIPGHPGKYLYVWLDAPIGYLSSFQALCEREGLDFNHYLAHDSTAELHHFLGKDIVNFHGLFWPAVLHAAGFRAPTRLHVNGYLTVDGAKMSKSRGTFVMARSYLDAGLEPEALRYYYATKTSGGVDDLDLNLSDFVARVNSDLVGKFVNIASRCSRILADQFDSQLSQTFPTADAFALAHEQGPEAAWKMLQASREQLDSPPLGAGNIDAFRHDATESVARDFQLLVELDKQYRAGKVSAALTSLMEICDATNAGLHRWAPWTGAKSADPRERQFAHDVLTLSLRRFQMVAVHLTPIVPALCARAADWLGIRLDHWQNAFAPPRATLPAYLPLFTRIDLKQIEAMIEASKESMKPSDAVPLSTVAADSPAPAAAPAQTAPAAAKADCASTIIGIDDFAKLDLRIGKVLVCEFVEGSDKLLRFQLDAGELGQRQIFSGIRASYGEPGTMVGRSVVFIANLAPRKMRFGVSEGMILSAGFDAGSLFLLDADTGAQPGMPVR